MQKIFNIVSVVALTLCVSVGCVPGKRFTEKEKEANKYRAQTEELKVDNGLLKKKIKQHEGEADKLRRQLAALQQDTTLYGMKNRTLRNQLAILENDLKALAARMGDSPEYRALMNHLLQMQNQLASSEVKRFDTQKAIDEQQRVLQQTAEQLAESEAALAGKDVELQFKNEELRGKNAELDSKNAELAGAAAALSEAQLSLAEQAARLKELEAILAQKDKDMAELKNNIANALVDFSSDELSVAHKNGKVYVLLEEKLLFASGKYDVNAKGVEALRKIAKVLEAQSKLNIVVEGHTDDVPFHGAVIEDNWDLSAKRATSVLRILLGSANISTNKIQASGRADSMPVDDSKTTEARRKNRRTEIILMPDVDAILNSLN